MPFSQMFYMQLGQTAVSTRPREINVPLSEAFTSNSRFCNVRYVAGGSRFASVRNASKSGGLQSPMQGAWRASVGNERV